MEIDNKKIAKILLVVLSVIVVTVFFFIELQVFNSNTLSEMSEESLQVIYRVYFIGAVFIIITFIGILILINIKKDIAIHIKYCLIATVIGILFFIFVPLLNGTDEYSHMLRSFEISQGNLITPVQNETSQGSVMPKAIDDLINSEKSKKGFNLFEVGKALEIGYDENETRYYENEYKGGSTYAPIQYLPYVIGILIGKLLNCNVYIILMLGKITAFIFWIVITTLAVKILPKHKMFMSLVLLTPILLSIVTTYSGDTTTIAIIALFISYIYNLIYTKAKIGKKQIAILATLSILVGICKLIYMPIVLILFLLPKDNFKSKHYYTIIISIILISAILCVGWLLQTGKYFNLQYPEKYNLQKEYILENPIDYACTLIRTISINTYRYVMESTTGYSLMLQEQVIEYTFVSLSYFAVMILALFIEDSEIKISKKQKIIIMGIIIIIALAIFTIMYTNFTSQLKRVGSITISGVQGRYFLPLLLLGMLLKDKKRFICNENTLLNVAIIIYIPIFLRIFINFIV